MRFLLLCALLALSSCIPRIPEDVLDAGWCRDMEAAKADAIMDDENRLTRLQALGEVVLTQPERRATGREIEYLVASETAILQGDLATIEDRARGVRTKGARLTLHLRDARIEINDESGAKRVRTTHRIQR